MIATWMVRAALFALLMLAAALAAERGLRLWSRQARFAWATSIGLSVAVPLIVLAQMTGALPRIDTGSAFPSVIAAPVRTFLPNVYVSATGSRLDAVLWAAWILVSVGLAARFGYAVLSVARRRRGWRVATLDGQRLLVSTDAGPAVIGFRRPEVVVPEWVLDLDSHLRALVLRHEREHVDGGDPRLLLGGVVAAVCFPWNPAIWLQLFRLRSAMEIDCDSRVLHAFPDVRRYGSLLLAVAQRGDRGGLLGAALTQSHSLLARRIVAMRKALPRHRVLRTTALGVMVAALTVVACETQTATESTRASRAAERAGSPAPVIVAPGTVLFEYQVEEPVTPAAGTVSPRYPDELRKAGVTGEVLAQFVVDTSGKADVATFKVLNQPNEAFVNAVKGALPQMRFNPAKVGGRAMKQLVQQPFTFSLAR